MTSYFKMLHFFCVISFFPRRYTKHWVSITTNGKFSLTVFMLNYYVAVSAGDIVKYPSNINIIYKGSTSIENLTLV